jgi:hypothetical protein
MGKIAQDLVLKIKKKKEKKIEQSGWLVIHIWQ